MPTGGLGAGGGRRFENSMGGVGGNSGAGGGQFGGLLGGGGNQQQPGYGQIRTPSGGSL